MIIGDNSRVVAYSYSTVNVGIKGVGTIFRVGGGGGGGGAKIAITSQP